MKDRLRSVFAGSAIMLALDISLALAQPASEPWKEPQDTVAAIFDSDRYAWRLFVALSWPANLATKEADPNKPLGAPGPVVWESWRNVNPLVPDAVFPSNGSDPGPWLGPGGPILARSERQFNQVPLKQQMLQALRQPPRRQGPMVVFDETVGTGNEVRVNKSTYEFVREQRLYNVEGQMAQAAAGKENLIFPANAKLIKAQWRKIKESDKPRYHWTEVTRNNGVTEPWGLTALHITTKDLPNWLWTTFEHIDNRQAGPVEGGPPNFGWRTKSVDRFACPVSPHDCEQAPTGISLQGTKWENYRLRGTQVDFVDTIGTPTILANSQIESGFQRTSSCITCHSLATINKDGQGLTFTAITGAPPTNQFRDPQTGNRLFMQMDFLWSPLFRASRANP